MPRHQMNLQPHTAQAAPGVPEHAMAGGRTFEQSPSPKPEKLVVGHNRRKSTKRNVLTILNPTICMLGPHNRDFKKLKKPTGG